MNYPEFTKFSKNPYDKLSMTGNDAPIYAQANQYLKYCSEVRQLSRCTMKGKVCALGFFIRESGCKDLKSLTNAHYDKFLEEENKRGVSNRAKNNKISHTLCFVDYWRKMGMVIPLRTALIFRLREDPPRRVFYTKEQVEEVLEKCENEREWLFIKIAFDTGMRLMELRNLSLSQINGRCIRFVGKGRKDRKVFLPNSTLLRLKKYIEEHQEIRDHVWVNDWGYPVSVDFIRNTMKKAFLRCGFEEFYPHALRHSFGSDLQRQGAKLMEIKEMMGHSNVGTTQRYLHTLDDQMFSLFDKYKKA